MLARDRETAGQQRAPFHAQAGVLVAGLLLWAGCLADADYTNPLDPRSEGFREVGIVAGEITGLDRQGIRGVEVRLEPGPGTDAGPLVAVTSSGGTFQIEDVPVGRYVLTLRKIGYAAEPDSNVTVEMAGTAVLAQQMDALPLFRNIALTTVHIGRYFAQTDLYLLEITATVDDPDGLFDLDSVWVDVPDFSFSTALLPTAEPRRFAVTVPADSLSMSTLHPLSGRPIMLHVADRAGFETTEPASFVRIIEELPVTESQQVTPEQDVLLAWQPANLPFEFTYRVDVFQVPTPTVQNLFRSVPNISPDTSSIRVAGPLPNGTYNWTVSVVDEYGNRSQSRPAGFTVP